MNKISIRFYNDHEVRAIWDEEQSKWYFSIVDIVAAITDSPNPRKYWSVQKTRLKQAGNELTTRVVKFRQWANKILKEYLVKGYAVKRPPASRPVGRTPPVGAGCRAHPQPNLSGKLRPPQSPSVCTYGGRNRHHDDCRRMWKL